MKKEIYTAIVFYHYSVNRTPAKYRNVIYRERLEEWLKKQEPSPIFINYYSKLTKAFIERKWLKDYSKP
jgi:hypothetical protein